MQIDSSGPGATAVTGADARAAPRNHLVYAAPVHQLSLVVAARAWPRVQRAYRFIDLILARRRRGTLAVDKMATSPAPRPRLPDLPAEIWLHIKHYIAFELFSEAQDHFFFEAHGFEDNMLWHELEDPDDAKFIPRIGRARLDCDHLKQCLECQYDIFSTQGRAYAISTNAKATITFLSDHGLSVACYYLVSALAIVDTEPDNPDLNAQSLITLAAGPSNGNWRYWPPFFLFGQIMSAEPQPLPAPLPSLPQDADARFARLFELMPAISSKAPDGKDPDGEGNPTIEARITPSWMTVACAR